MAIKPSITNNYVKFVRTNNTLWQALGDNKNGDTLYFVVEPGAKNGSLYLGQALIATSIDEGLSLEELKDVAFSVNLQNDDVVVHEDGKWVNKPISSFMPVGMIGASETEDGAGGLVPAPAAGNHTMYLRGDGEWADPTTQLSETVGKLQTTVGDLETNLGTVIGSDVGLSMRDVANAAVTDLINGAPEAFDTLKEIADWITGAHEGSVDAADLIADVTTLKEQVQKAETGLLTRVGTLETQVATLTTDLGSLYGNFDTLSLQVETNATNIETNKNDILAIRQLLMWNELLEVDE